MSHKSLTAAAGPPSPSCGAVRRGAITRLCSLALVSAPVFLTPVLGGCSMSIPMASLMPGGDDVTGSNSPVPFGRMLEEEDRRRELAALATALDPQGDGTLVKWENAKSGQHGAVVAEGKAYTTDSKVCRGFRSELSAEKPRVLRGTACAVSAGEWRVSEATQAH